MSVRVRSREGRRKAGALFSELGVVRERLLCDALHFCARPTPPLSPDLIRATHARPLHPAALASVPFGIVLVRVRVPPRSPKTPGRGGKENNNDACAQRRLQKKEQKQDGTGGCRSLTNAPVVSILLNEPPSARGAEATHGAEANAGIHTGTCGCGSPIYQYIESARRFAMRQWPEKIRCGECIVKKKKHILSFLGRQRRPLPLGHRADSRPSAAGVR